MSSLALDANNGVAVNLSHAAYNSFSLMICRCFLINSELISHDSVLTLDTDILFPFYREVEFFNLKKDQTLFTNVLKPSSKEY